MGKSAENIIDSDDIVLDVNPDTKIDGLDSEDFWENLKDSEQDLGTFVWLAGIVVDVGGEPIRAFVTARTKQFAIIKICQILSSDEIDFDVSKYDDYIDVLQAYFNGEPNRDIFMMLCPLE